MRRPCPFLIAACLAVRYLSGADAVFSGPQPGEKTTGFKVVEIGGAGDGSERDPVKDNAGAPTALVFIHTVERSLLPLLRVIDGYGAERTDRIKTEVIFLKADRLSGEQQVRAANGSLRLRARVSLSPDGPEGPGNYGLNKDCMMTIVMAKGNVVTASIALVQPGIADAPAVVAALAKTCGDDKPPTIESLTAGRQTRGAMKREPLDLARLDLNSEAGLRAAATALTAEVEALRREIAELRGQSGTADKPKDKFPGAVPTDGKLVGLLREFIRPTNDDATVDRVLADVKAHIEGNADLTRQALDGWTRVMHFENYGTPHARKVGQEFLDKLRTP